MRKETTAGMTLRHLLRRFSSKKGTPPLEAGQRAGEYPALFLFFRRGVIIRFVLVHHIPGRARLRTSEVFGHETSIGLADGLEVLPGVEGVRVNPRTGSVLLLYQTEDALSRACAFLTGFEILPEP